MPSLNVLKLRLLETLCSRTYVKTSLWIKIVFKLKKGWGESIPPHPHPHLVVFLKMYLVRRGRNPAFLCLLILSKVASFLKISLNFFVQKIWRFFVNISYMLAIYHFSSISWIFWHFLVIKKLMTSAYNMSAFFTLNLF